MRLKNKVAFVTGATKGIGAQIARRFAEEGASVAICGRSRELGEEIADSINANGGTAIYTRADISKEHEVADAVKATVDRFGALHILVNNAAPTDVVGDGHEKPCVNQTMEEFDNIMNVGIRGTVVCCRAAIPEMERAGGGAIVNISSFASILGVRGVHAYTCAKGAMNAMTRQHAVDYASAGIRSNCIVVGVVATELFSQMFTAYPQVEEALRAVSLTRLGTPDDVAEAAIYLGSDAAGYVTGITLPVDGGISCKSSVPDIGEIIAGLTEQKSQ